MATREHRGASGLIELYFDFYESASGHKDSGSSAKLITVDESTLKLEVESHSMNVYKGSSGNNYHEIYEISVEDLINAIKKSGKKVEGKIRLDV